MASDKQFSQAFNSFARRENLPASLTSDEWASIPSEIRERAFFMSQVQDAEILGYFRGQIEAVLRGEIGENEAEKRIDMWLRSKGYKPPEGKAGSLQDLSSLGRINVVLRTNIDMARGHAQWVRKQTAIRSFPCQKLFRLSQRMEPRDWDRIWDEAKAALAYIPGVHPTEKIALLNHPIWRVISRFNNPYPPFDFNSGMWVESVSRADALALGFKLDPNNDPMQKPLHESMNEGLEMGMDLKDPRDGKSLAKSIGRFGNLEKGRIVFTDPDGTKKYTATQLAELWQRPAPAGYDRLTQKEALDAWNDGFAEDRQEDRIKLRQLFDRIETPVQPEQVFRSIDLRDEQVRALAQILESRLIRIPGNVAAWSWSDKAPTIADAVENGWRIILRLANGKTIKDIGPLRPEKPGFVTVSGTEFQVVNFDQDPLTRTIIIDIIEP